MENALIAKLQRLHPLDADAVTALSTATANARHMAPKRDLIREGDRPGPVFVMLSGWACRYKILPNGTRAIVGFMMPGDACDLNIGLLAEMDHSIQTLTSALVATIQREEMDEMMEIHRSVAKAMYVSQLIDEGTMRAWITSMGRRSSIERVAHLMAELYIRARTIGVVDEPVMELPFSQLLLADALGMTSVHLNRVLKELRLTGAITIKRSIIAIVDPIKLIQIAGFDENYLHRRTRVA